MSSPTRDDAWRLLVDWTPSEALRKHGLAVEATVGWYAEHRFGIAGPELEFLEPNRPAEVENLSPEMNLPPRISS